MVGGSNSAAEAALALYRSGAFVTLVHRRERLSGSIKYWVKPDIENRIAENAIASRFEAEVVRIGPGSVEIEGPEGPGTNVPGFYVAGGHEGDAMSLAPITGLRIAQLITGEIDPAILAPFSSSRFQRSAQPAQHP